MESTVCGIFNQEYAKFNEVMVKFKSRIIFNHYVPKKRKIFGIKIRNWCDISGYTYDMSVFLPKDAETANGDMFTAHSTIRNLTHKNKGEGNKAFMDNSFFSHAPFHDLEIRKINVRRKQ
jgi:hypothetical protein